MTADRLTDLELRYTEQQSLLEELSQVLYAQQKELDLVKAELEALRRRVASVEEMPVVGPAEKPPHY